jgi:hypothetical protein
LTVNDFTDKFALPRLTVRVSGVAARLMTAETDASEDVPETIAAAGSSRGAMGSFCAAVMGIRVVIRVMVKIKSETHFGNNNRIF